MKRIFLISFVCFLITMVALAQVRTQTLNTNIKSLQIHPTNQQLSLPIIQLHSNETLDISFDELSHESHSYGYRIIHYNADWSPSNLTSNEYLNGFTSGEITNFWLSQNTTVLYTHYRFQIPNEDISFKVSGNYLVEVYEDNKIDKPIAQACFYIVEPKVQINANIRSNTDIELNNRLQQVDFDILLNGYSSQNPSSEIKVVVRQNNRIDNQVSNLQPTYISDSKLSYINNKQLIFEGGNEYHRFDISSIYAPSNGIESIKYVQPFYEVILSNDKMIAHTPYLHNFDVNGKFIINYQESTEDVNYESDYLKVHFKLPINKIFLDGDLYLGGEFNYNKLDNNNRLIYNTQTGNYEQTLLLKQGGYNYQYWFVPNGYKKGIVERVDGSYWQTSNQYTIYIYHRPWGERYDKLIGIKNIE